MSIGDRPLLGNQLNTIQFTAEPATPTAVNSTDSEQPYTDSYSFTVAQKLPWSGLVEVAYVGNQSHALQNTGGYGSNINLVPYGAMFGAANPSLANPNNYRPYLGYSDINEATNNLYANYDALQVKYAHQGKNATIQLNYTYGKSLGIIGTGGTTLSALSASLDPFDLRANYGVEPGDRRNIFNAAYSYQLPSPFHNKIAGGFVNGWQVSGITILQSGNPLTYGSAGFNFNMQLNGAILPGTQNIVNPDGSTGVTISNQSILGTNAIQLNPILTCNPAANLGHNQWINGSCFAAPTVAGQNGPTLLPPMYGPAFFSSDLALFKNFNISESKKLQFRVDGFNFLNHSLSSFPNGNNLTLQFTQAVPGGPIVQSNPAFGYAEYKQGQRIIELTAKFYF